MKTAKLKDVAEIVSGATPKTRVAEYWDGDIHWVTPADLSQLSSAYVSDTPRRITAAGLNSCAARVLPPNSVLLSSRAPIGHVAINTTPMATNQGFKSLIPAPGLDSKYLYHWLTFKKDFLKSLGNGATFKELSRRTTEQIEIPIPPLDEQRRIAAILDQADAIRTKRRQQLAHLASLPSAIFREQDLDSRRHPRVQLSELGTVTTGKTPPSSKEGMFGGEIPFVTPGDLISEGATVRTVTHSGAEASRVVRKGATLVCCIGATIGKVGTTRALSAFNQQINAIEWGDKVNDIFGFEAVKEIKPLIVSQGSSTTLPLLPKSRFSQLQISVPSKDEQEIFSARVTQVLMTKIKVQAALNRDDELFASLQSRAFRGEL